MSMVATDQIDDGLHLLDLPAEAIAIITRYVDVHDLVNLSCTSKSLCTLLDKDEVWESHVADWLRSQDIRSGVRDAPPTDIKRSFGLHTYRATLEALFSLKAWPVGVWSCTEPPWYPHGVLARVVQRGNTFECGFVFPAPVPTAEAQPWPADNATYSVRKMCSVQIVSHSGVWMSERAALEKDWYRFAATGDIKFDRVQPHMYVAWHGAEGQQLAAQQAHEQPAGGGDRQPGWFTLKRTPELAQLNIADIQIDEREHCLPSGMYVGLYGPHGVEVLSVLAMGPQSPAPPGCPLNGLARIQGQKLVGDPNVPASKVSFVAALDQYRPGPYQPERDDPFPQPDGNPRPIVSTHGLGPVEFMDLESRPVAFVLPHAAGQINRVPRTWAPEWVRATIVVYERKRSESVPLFTVIFEDEGENFRHAIDFFSFPSTLPFDSEVPLAG